MGARQTIFIIFVLAIAAVGSMCAFVVDQRQQALVLQFGNLKDVEEEPGLHFKLPWQTIERFDKRLLVQDAAPNEVITKDKKKIIVDSYTRWRIIDPLKVYQVARTQQGVAARMEDVVRGKVREVLGQHTLLEIVSGGKEAILRAKLMKTIRNKADKDAKKKYGIEIVDVRIKRADLPPENAEKVYDRMKAERQRIAKEYRSQGEEAAKEIRAEADKKVKVLLAGAYKQSQIIRGRAEAKANRIYVKAHRLDPKFYAFWRSLKAYRESISEGTTLVVSPDSEFFHYFEQARK